MRHKPCLSGYMARNTQKREKFKIHISGRVLWRENSKTTKMRCKHSMTWNMARDTQKRKK